MIANFYINLDYELKKKGRNAGTKEGRKPGDMTKERQQYN